jgi:hypothetical protein
MGAEMYSLVELKILQVTKIQMGAEMYSLFELQIVQDVANHTALKIAIFICPF